MDIAIILMIIGLSILGGAVTCISCSEGTKVAAKYLDDIEE